MWTKPFNFRLNLNITLFVHIDDKCVSMFIFFNYITICFYNSNNKVFKVKTKVNNDTITILYNMYLILKIKHKIHYTRICILNGNIAWTFTTPLTLFCLDDKLEIFVISTDFVVSQWNDFTATSFTDLHFNTKLRIPNGTSPIRVYDITLM